MAERDGYPTGVPCWVDTEQVDPDAALAFYGGLFGWEFEERMPAGAPDRYAVATVQGKAVAGIGSRSDGDGGVAMPTWNTYIWVDSADEAAARARQAGGTILLAPEDVFDAGRTAVFADPTGAAIRVWEAGRHRGAQLVNDPGTWVFSELNTRDLDTPRAFYNKVFGWEASTVDLAGSETTMWRRPGYGDYLVQLNPPGWREALDEFGAPEGFADAVGWMNDMKTGPFPADVPPHWSITFSVDDTDAAVERVVKLGGRVIVEPFDAPPVRMAVVADPQGTVFTVSCFDATMSA